MWFKGNYYWSIASDRTKKLSFWETLSTSSRHSLKSKTIADSDEDSDKEIATMDVIYQGNTVAFLSEVFETMESILTQKSLISSAQIDKMKLEINASKLAYNIPVDELSKNIFLAFISVPLISNSFNSFTKVGFL